MNGYAIILIGILVIIFVSIFGLGPEIKEFSKSVADVPAFDVKRAENPEVLTMAIRAMYLIALVAVAKLLFWRKKDD